MIDDMIDDPVDDMVDDFASDQVGDLVADLEYNLEGHPDGGMAWYWEICSVFCFSLSKRVIFFASNLLQSFSFS